MEANDILDPAHDPDTGTNMGAAGLPGPEPKPDAPKQPEYKVSDDGNVAEIGGKKYITESALHEARGKAKQYQDTLAQLDPVMPEFEEFLRTREQRKTAATSRAASGDIQDDKSYLEEVALALGFYDEQNQPDHRRAQAHLNITRRESKREAERAVRPVAEHSTRDRAAVNRERARAARYLDGQPIAGEQYMDAALKALPDEYLADPNIANISQVIAAGLEYLDLRKSGEFRRGGRGNQGGAPARREPIFREQGRGRVDGDDEGGLSELDIAAARARGKTPEQWSKLAQRANPRSAAKGDSVAFEDA
jgi:hypothetical protein